MKMKYIFIGLWILSTLSCIDDKSDIGLGKLSLITYADQGLDSLYELDRHEVLQLQAPAVKQEYKEKDLRYEWQVNYEVVGEEDTLNFVCTELGEFNCRLKIYNDDGAFFQTFKLNVKAAYEEGVMVLSKYNGASLVSFKRMDKEGSSAIRDVYTLDNPTIPLGSEPTGLFFNNYTGEESVYIMTSQPAKAVRLDIKTFKVTDFIDIPGDTKIYNMSGQTFFSEICMLGEGKFYNFNLPSNMALETTWKTFPEDAVFSDKSAFMYDVNYLQIGYTLWEETKSELWIYVQAGMPPYSLTGDLLKGKDLLAISPCNYQAELLLTVQDQKTGEVSMVHYAPSQFSPDYFGPTPPPLGNLTTVNAPSERGITNKSVFATRQATPITYYSVGNQVYLYNYVGGNFADQPAFSAGSGDERIVAMTFTPDEKKILVATDSPNAEYRGSIYCFDTETNKLLWSEPGLTGEVVAMIYKDTYFSY